MRTRTRILLAMVTAGVLAVLTGLLLLDGSVSVAMWMEGPYFPLTRVLPAGVDTLETMLVVVAIYYFIAALVAFKCSSRRVVVLVVLVVIVVNTLGAFAWHRFFDRHANADRLTARCLDEPRC
jgi:hypothetical protein